VPLNDFASLVRQEVTRRSSIAFLKMDIEGSEIDVPEAMDRQGLFTHLRQPVAKTHALEFKQLRPRHRLLRETIARNHPSGRISLDWI
jgi:hypothetical protein